MNELEPIFSYSMDEMEAKAFKIALMWHDECSRELRGEKFETLKKGKDPRKTNLFKHCYKMARELSGLIPDNELSLYVRAQIQILRSIGDGRSHAMVSPQCLVGEKAWKRWKLWKFRSDKNSARIPTSEEAGILAKESIILRDLCKTGDFLESKNLPSDYAEIRTELERWISTGEVSPFYVVLSPRTRKLFGNEMPVDEALYRPSINPSIEKFFRERFDHEFR